uniref:PiggyBac transposable element-derived protein domain-containing protein n=1 Tax=Clastoptera arizonana TaxID=38151 RepID=A0A1B6CUG3_9HEMI
MMSFPSMVWVKGGIIFDKTILRNFFEGLFDNYYSSLRLVERLKTEKILAACTVKKQRKGLPQLADDKTLKCGHYDYRISNLGVAVFKWQDNRPVYLTSNFHGCEETTVKRTNKEGKKIGVKCPEIVKNCI